MNQVPLNELLYEFKENPPIGSDPEVLTLTEKNGFIRQSDRFNKRLAMDDTSGYKHISIGDIAFNPYLLWAGAIAQNAEWKSGVISPLYPTFRLKPGFDSRYVIRLLLSEELIQRYDSIAFGSVPRRRRSSVKDFLNLTVPQPPPINIQKRIADVLDQVDTLREQRRRSITLLEELTKSIFLDMFGDPISNDRGWTAGTVGSFVKRFESGKSLAPGRYDSESAYRVLKVSAVTSGTFSSTESKPLPVEYTPPSSHLVRNGDLIFCRANGNPNLIGVTTFVNQIEPRYALPDKLWRFVWKEDCQADPRFVHGLFSQPGFRERIKQSTTGNGVKNISQTKVLSQPAILPPLHLQEAYARTVAATDANKQRMVTHLKMLDSLFASIQSRAFRGDLWQDDLKDL